jgi:hypothetical protein
MDFPIEDVVKNFRHVLDSIKRVTGNVKKRDQDDTKQRKGTLAFGCGQSMVLIFVFVSDSANEGYSQHEECSGNTNIGLLDSVQCGCLNMQNFGQCYYRKEKGCIQ